MKMFVRFAPAIILVSSATVSVPLHAQIILTLGSGFSSPQDVAVDGSGNVFVADFGHNAVKEILAPAYTTVITLGSGFSFPFGVAVNGSGNVFVGDYGNNEVKEILSDIIFRNGFE